MSSFDLTIAKSENNVSMRLEDVVFEITTNDSYLEQYFILRERCYREDLGLKDFSGAIDEYDRSGLVSIARIGDKVIGGSRMTVSLPDQPHRLPLEEDGFLMKDLFPMLELNKLGYFEIGRTAVDAGYRTSQVNFEINKQLVLWALKMGCCYQFTISTAKVSRINRMIGTKMGMEHLLLDWIEVPHKPVYQNLIKEGIYLSVSFIRPDETAHNKDSLQEIGNLIRKMTLDKLPVAA